MAAMTDEAELGKARSDCYLCFAENMQEGVLAGAQACLNSLVESGGGGEPVTVKQAEQACSAELTVLGTLFALGHDAAAVLDRLSPIDGSGGGE